jgi:PPOX class probable F420-dependent enzyme
MSGQRERIRMTDAEVAEFLNSEKTLQVASIGPDGVPHLVPMFFGLIDGRIAMWTYGKSQKAANLRRDPRVTCLAETGVQYGELRGVAITGRAELNDDYDTVFAVGEALQHRYQGGEMTHASRAGIEAESRKRIAVFVDPVKTVSWDHRKL